MAVDPYSQGKLEKNLKQIPYQNIFGTTVL